MHRPDRQVGDERFVLQNLDAAIGLEAKDGTKQTLSVEEAAVSNRKRPALEREPVSYADALPHPIGRANHSLNFPAGEHSVVGQRSDHVLTIPVVERQGFCSSAMIRSIAP